MFRCDPVFLRVAQPPGNRQLGKFSGAQNLNRSFGREIARKQRAERNRILGRETVTEEAQLGPARGRRIRAKYKGKFIKARLRADKRVRMKGKLYGSPSAAASAIGKRAMNGWSFWRYERGPGDWVPIDELRNA
jgi:Restriction Enzyme Adenine Methylase Associated